MAYNKILKIFRKYFHRSSGDSSPNRKDEYLEKIKADEKPIPKLTLNELILETAKSQLGVKEIEGKKHNEVITNYAKEVGFTKIKDDETPWCLTGDIEVLTDKGFIRLDSVSNIKDLKVAQLNTSTHKVEFTESFNWIKKKYKGELYNIKNSSLDLSCDPKHEFYGKWSSGKIYKKRQIKTITKYGVAIPTISSGNTDNTSISDLELKLLGAYLSDGTRVKNRIYFGVSKERKIEALKLLNPEWYKLDSKSYNDRKILTKFAFKVPKIFKVALKDYKSLDWNFISSLSQRQCKLFIDNYSLYDGTPEPYGLYSLFTIDHSLACDLTYMSNMAGYKTTMYPIKTVSDNTKAEYLYTIYVSYKKHKYVQPHHITISNYEGSLYCVEVPSGVFIIRDRNKNIIPIGNCSTFINWIALKLGAIRSNKPNARSWLNVGTIPDYPIPGDICILWRGSKSSWQGHVGVFVKFDPNGNIVLLGGNQSNSVSYASFSPSRLLGFRRLSYKEVKDNVILNLF